MGRPTNGIMQIETLNRIFGWPHELLHALALLLIGRRPVGIAQTHIDIPDDLTTAQFVFVAGLPALVFWGIAAVAALALLNAPSILHGVLWLLIGGVAALAAFGTVGDLTLIAARLIEARGSGFEE